MLQRDLLTTRARRFVSPAASLFPALGSITATIVVWQILASNSPGAVPPFSSVAQSLAEALRDVTLLRAMGTSLQAVVAGVCIACVLAIPSGLLIGLSPRLEASTRWLIELMRPISSVILLPIAILLLGTGLQLKLFLIAFASFWPILFNAKTGAESVDSELIETAKVLGLGPVARFFRVVLPASLPPISTGVRVSTTIALVVVITVEMMVGASGGIGVYLESARLVSRLDLMWASLLFVGCVGVLLNYVLTVMEKRAVRWSYEHRLG